MDVLPLQFLTLRCFGLWCEPHEQRQRWLERYIWRPLVIIVIALFATSQLAAATSVYRDGSSMSDLTECIFVSLTYVTLCLKLFNFLRRSNSMNELLGEFRQSIFVPRTNDERMIVSRYRQIASRTFILLASVAQSTALAFDLLPLITLVATDKSRDKIELPYKTYEIPWGKDNLVYFWLTYVFQVLALIVGIFVNASLDTMLTGFILLTCAQIDLSCHRFAHCSATELTKECAIHQQSIRRVVRRIQSFFMCVVLPLLFFSLITLCTSIYNISQTKIGAVESFPFLMYLSCILVQVFLYCWFGNELKLKSTSICKTIYDSDWTAFEPKERKNLYFIMLACRKDMSISYHGLCPITLEIYIWVLKTSYAAYNLLKTVEASSNE